MDPKAEELLRQVCGSVGKENMSEVFAQWRDQHEQIVDFSGAVFRRANLRKALFGGLNLDGATFEECALTAANFKRASLKNAEFRDCELNGAKFEEVQGEGIRFPGADLRRVWFDHATLTDASLLGARVDASTRFRALEGVQGCKLDRHSLACLGDARGELTVGNLMDMDIRDDVAELRSHFSGGWMWGHVLALIVFAAPYVWFVVSQWARARFLPLNETSISLGEAIGRFIVSGGEGWREGWNVNWWPLVLFLAYLAYNGARVSLLVKTKGLETKQAVSGVPVRFSLETPGLGGVCWWKLLLRAVRWGFWGALAIVVLNTWHFLQMRVPL